MSAHVIETLRLELRHRQARRLHAQQRGVVSRGERAEPPGARQLGIYRWRADTLEFCFAKVTQPRPTGLGTCARDGLTWTRWVRAK